MSQAGVRPLSDNDLTNVDLEQQHKAARFSSDRCMLSEVGVRNTDALFS
jgi:hypothetical protein